MLQHGQLVGQHLGGVPLVRQSIPHRDAGELSQSLDVLLLLAAELDAVIEAAQHPSGVRHGLLVAHLGTGGVEVGDLCALVVGGHLEGAAGARRGLLKNESDVLTGQPLHLAAGLLVRLELGGQLEQGAPLLSREVELFEETAVVQGVGHEDSFVQCGDVLIVLLVCRPGPTQASGSRRVGQLMQCGPPRPRPTSEPGMVRTSMPWEVRYSFVLTLRS